MRSKDKPLDCNDLWLILIYEYLKNYNQIYAEHYVSLGY